MTLLLGACSSHEEIYYSGLGLVQFEANVVTSDPAFKVSPIALTITSADGKYSHTWDNINDYSKVDPLHVGWYEAHATIGDFGVEGFGCPCYSAKSNFEIIDGTTTLVRMSLRLTQAVITVRQDNTLMGAYVDTSVSLHTAGGGYVTVGRNQTQPVYINPGQTSLSVHITDRQGRQAAVRPDFSMPTVAESQYEISVGIEDGKVLVVKCGNITSKIELTDEMFDTPSPSISCIGFNDNVPVDLTAGYPFGDPLKMDVSAPAGVKSIILTTISNGLVIPNLPSECDILDPELDLQAIGLDVDCISPDKTSVDFTKLLSSFTVDMNTDVTFIVQAHDYLDRVSTPSILRVAIQNVEIQLIECTGAIIGEDRATITVGINVPEVEVNDFTIYQADRRFADNIPLEIVSSSFNAKDKTVTFTFSVPSGTSDVPVCIEYMGEPRLTVTVGRRVPDYSLSTDAFATFVRIKVKASSPKITSAITQYVKAFNDGKEVTIVERNLQEGLIICTGLKPSTKYTLTAQVIDQDDALSCSFATESAAQLPDADLENYRVFIEYEDLASGGVYSSTTFPIFNQQNFVDVKVSWPKDYWMSINKKTFCTKAKNHNTWYMQPSSWLDRTNFSSGNKSACITSVGWSLDGPELAPYLQKEGGFQPYSGNEPPIDHVSAGVLFLGSYSFNASDMTETYSEGLKFTSRPSSLNGYFRYLPDVSNIYDRGWCLIELVNVSTNGIERIIARGRMEFAQNPDFKSFNIPLTYNIYDLSPNLVRIMFCSSIYSQGIGDDNLSIPVSPKLESACFTGSSLWIDDLTFSY